MYNIRNDAVGSEMANVVKGRNSALFTYSVTFTRILNGLCQTFGGPSSGSESSSVSSYIFRWFFLLEIGISSTIASNDSAFICCLTAKISIIRAKSLFHVLCGT